MTRVIITENESTLMIIFDEPSNEEYIIKNKTDYDLSF
jgi:hypothetical protein